MRRFFSKALKFFRLVRENPRSLPKYLLAVHRLAVYEYDPREVKVRRPCEEVRFRKLTDEELASFESRDDELARQARCFNQLRFNRAYAAYVGAELAHVAWLIGAKEDSGRSIRNVKLRAGEAEITYALTLPRFRGRGVYPFVISKLCEIAARQEVERVFMIANLDNVDSRRGIEKAGFRCCGRVVAVLCPLFPRVRFTLRGHRWRRILR